jgi:hypothetical protein
MLLVAAAGFGGAGIKHQTRRSDPTQDESRQYAPAKGYG